MNTTIKTNDNLGQNDQAHPPSGQNEAQNAKMTVKPGGSGAAPCSLSLVMAWMIAGVLGLLALVGIPTFVSIGLLLIEYYIL